MALPFQLHVRAILIGVQITNANLALGWILTLLVAQ